MIGIFDSGAGGLVAFRELRKIAPRADICFFADRKNAPYGTKSQERLVELAGRDIRILTEAGANEILIACCTASTVYPLLTEQQQRMSHPIITPTVRAALNATGTGRIGVIATCATVSSHAFRDGLTELCPDVHVVEEEAQSFVDYVERGYINKRDIEAKLNKIKKENIDTLILGCTHFPRISCIISEVMGNIRLISSAREGALEIAKTADLNGNGATIYLEEKRTLKWQNTDEAGSTMPWRRSLLLHSER